jgi:predicted nucleic acid-binding protein
MKIISNTGPIIGLAKIDLLSLLNQIASEVLIPPMVHRELMGKAGLETAQIDKALRDFLRDREKNRTAPFGAAR